MACCWVMSRSLKAPSLFTIKTKGRCFRYLAHDHKISSCRDPLKCFLCFTVGHRASGRQLGASQHHQTPPSKRAQLAVPLPRQAPLKSLLCQALPRPSLRRVPPKLSLCQAPLKPSAPPMALLGTPDTRLDEDYCIINGYPPT